MGDLSSRLLVHHQLNPINDSRQMNVINIITTQTHTLLTVGIDNYYSGIIGMSWEKKWNNRQNFRAY